MSVEENKELARRFEEEVHNQQKLDVIDEIIAPKYTNNGPKGSRTYTREELKDLFRKVIPERISDFHDEIHEMVASGNLVAFRLTRSVTDKEGKRSSHSGFHLFRIEEGKIAEAWYLFEEK